MNEEKSKDVTKKTRKKSRSTGPIYENNKYPVSLKLVDNENNRVGLFSPGEKLIAELKINSEFVFDKLIDGFEITIKGESIIRLFFNFI